MSSTELRGYNQLTWDGLTIIALGWAHEGGELRIGTIIESITPYSENGEMACVIWFEVQWVSGTIRRFNGSLVEMVEIKYN